MPVFEDLLPEPYNTIIMDLLFKLIQWLSLTKLWQHSETSLTHLEVATVSLGMQVRTFMTKVCPQFETMDTPHKAGARVQRQAVKAPGNKSATSSQMGKETASNRQQWDFNPNMYKFHVLGDYTLTIQQFGAIDNYNTQNISHWQYTGARTMC